MTSSFLPSAVSAFTGQASGYKLNMGPLQAGVRPTQTTNPTETQHQKARAAAQDFEAFFLRTFLDDIQPDLSENALFGGGHAESVWASEYNAALSKILAQRGGFGLADVLYRDILRLQAGAQAGVETGVETGPPHGHGGDSSGLTPGQALNRARGLYGRGSLLPGGQI